LEKEEPFSRPVFSPSKRFYPMWHAQRRTENDRSPRVLRIPLEGDRFSSSIRPARDVSDRYPPGERGCKLLYRSKEKTMITLRRSEERGHFQADWLDSYHTFSFDTYYDPKHMGFRNLRVINEDRVQHGEGFPLHPHRDMEILTFILEGELEHRDSLGNGAVIRAGEVQRITAGTGIRHGEFNPSATKEVHLLQIWILPETVGLPPSYENRTFSGAGNLNRLQLIASPDGAENSAVIHQDVRVFSGTLEPGKSLEYPIREGRHGWLQVTGGYLTLNDRDLRAGDGAAASEEPLLRIKAAEKAQFILFDLN
jgi:redox-sensitive bicupin YhaK (pirin superfamily)